MQDIRRAASRESSRPGTGRNGAGHQHLLPPEVQIHRTPPRIIVWNIADGAEAGPWVGSPRPRASVCLRRASRSSFARMEIRWACKRKFMHLHETLSGKWYRIEHPSSDGRPMAGNAGTSAHIALPRAARYRCAAGRAGARETTAPRPGRLRGGGVHGHGIVVGEAGRRPNRWREGWR